MKPSDQLQKRFIKDRFVSEGLGAVIESASPGFARCTMQIQSRHCNALGFPMGGAIFTLADFAFAVATNQNGRAVVTQASQITFLSQAVGNKLIAEAKAVRDGKQKTCFYRVDVKDDSGNTVAFVTVTGYVLHTDI